MRLRLLAASVAAASLIACSDSLVPDLNNPGVDTFDNPTRSQIATLMRGVVVASRNGYGSFILDAGIVGRDAYNFDNADPRWVDEMLVSLDPGGFGGRHWLNRYQAVRTANLLITATGNASEAVLDDAERSAVLGFANTMKAHELMKVYESRGPLGLPVEVGADARDLQPILCEAPALAEIVSLLDEGLGQLEAGGSAFPAQLPSGFDGFDTPATFAEFNRALRAKVAVYQGDYAAALAALAESFVDTLATPLDAGVYHTYSTSSGDVVNPLYQDPATTNYRAHRSFETDAPRVGDLVDRRFTEKVMKGDVLGPSENVSSDLIITVYSGLDSPIPIITNEELILLRAEANLGAGNLVAASNDLSYMRRTAGGLPPLLPTSYDTPQEVEDELLVQKRYSLFFESPSRWVDMRRYDRLGELPLDDPETHQVAPVFPIPTAEVLARDGNVTCQSS